MPAGVTWGRYLRFFTASMLSMFAGAQVVHLIYRPLDDMEEWVEKEKKKKQEEPVES
ncbi:ubiquinol-cytochrome c reductase complex assembly factor 6-like [Babylonia areolata]|uniref:ubiquinol-cytochrome c reductase complex assembly factor 6-like n=1 Tax=Babylonia areolata TaxID=304850 RepID=UPI003FD2D846